MNDSDWMKLAIQEGQKARLISPPNPWVGCVLVKKGAVVGAGATRACGGDHAEVVACQEAGKQAAGATAYVTLEPCAHYGKTPPCTQLLIDQGVARCVIAVKDPDPKVAGQGIAHLQAKGMQVDVGCCKEEAERSLLPYLFHRTFSRPLIVGKAAVSIDGRIAAEDGSSQWISTEQAKESTHKLRANSQAILIGVGTALQDDPLLTVRDVPLPIAPPLRVVLDPQGRLPIQCQLSNTAVSPTLIATTTKSAAAWRDSWEKKGAEVFILSEENLLPHLFSHLAERGVLQVLVEGGGKTFAHLQQEGLLDVMRILVGPRVIGEKGVALFATSFGTTLQQCPTLSLLNNERCGDTVIINYSVSKQLHGFIPTPK